MKWSDLIKIGVSGSRRFKNVDAVTAYLDQHIVQNYKDRNKVAIITGGAVGVDCAVMMYCKRQGVVCVTVHPQWLQLGKSAGPSRNQTIVDLSDIMFAFWNGESKGTANFIKRAKKSGKSLIVMSEKQTRKAAGFPAPHKIKLPSKKHPTVEAFDRWERKKKKPILSEREKKNRRMKQLMDDIGDIRDYLEK